MFVDEAEIYVEAGRGGQGCKSFQNIKGRGKKRPNGGDGGQGGHIIIRTDPDVYTLLHLRHKKHMKAEPGGNGGPNNKKGKDGLDSLVKVPPGTIIYSPDEHMLLRELDKPNEEVIVVKGGQGSRGNAKVKKIESPQPGQKRHLFLELKLIAEVGLIGYPNAGKSSLISVISKAKPKIAAYPFTTKVPVLGIVEYKDKDFKVADIPGLIEGAHEGSGLGDRFLRHIERTQILIFVIDVAAVDARVPFEDYKALRKEIRLYKQKLLDKPSLIVANKMDLPEAKNNLAKLTEEIDEEVIAIS
jgi:GTP-binding protein